MKRGLIGIILTLVLSIFVSPVVFADSYDVSAEVPYQVPSIPATANSGLNNITVGTRVFQLSGNCQFIAPATVLSIYRSGASIGSTACAANGTYSIAIDLVVGSNVLTIRTSNLNDVYGPDSLPVNVTYSPIAPSTPQTQGSNTAPSAQTDQSSDLSIATEHPFAQISADQKSVTIAVVVGGGASPYTIEINWGDGSVDTKQVASAGSYVFSHDYKKSIIYQAKATVTDVLGIIRTHFFAIIANGPLSQEATRPSGDNAVLASNETGGHWYDSWGAIPVAAVVFCSGLGAGIVLANGGSFASSSINSLKLKKQHEKKK